MFLYIFVSADGLVVICCFVILFETLEVYVAFLGVRTRAAAKVVPLKTRWEWGSLTDVGIQQGSWLWGWRGIDWLVMHSSSLKESRVLSKALVTSEVKGCFAGS